MVEWKREIIMNRNLSQRAYCEVPVTFHAHSTVMEITMKIAL